MRTSNAPSDLSSSTSFLGCPICLDTLETPVLATCCGQSFCCDCLDAALAKVDACPMCREPLLRGGKHSVTRNRALEAIVAQLPESMRNSDRDSEKGGKRDRVRDGAEQADEQQVLIQILRDDDDDDDDDDGRSGSEEPQHSERTPQWPVRWLRRQRRAFTAAVSQTRETLRWRRYAPHVCLNRLHARCGGGVACQQWQHWCRIHWSSLQCVFYVVLFFVFVSFLRVQEEEFADHQPHQ